ncbi:MAG: hypothetical protein GY847_42125, partial [Proteobacteria bacterium]|nr:hypothetical protein [Pseudomonadota bacterium]
ERVEREQQFDLIVDKAIQIQTQYKLGSLDKIGDLDLNEQPMLPAVILQGIRDGFHHMSPGITNQQVNRGALNFLLHILSATGRTLPRQLISQVDHPCIGVFCTDRDREAVESGAVPDPRGLWYRFLDTEVGRQLKPPEALLNMLHLMPSLTSTDDRFRLTRPDELIDMVESLKESLDSRGSPARVRLWHLIVSRTGFDPLNPQTGIYREVNDETECPPREYMDGRAPS